MNDFDSEKPIRDAVRKLLELSRDPTWLELAQATVADKSLALDDVLKVVPAELVEFASFIADTDDIDAFIAGVKDENLKAELLKTIPIVEEHLAGIDCHPAVVARLRSTVSRLLYFIERQQTDLALSLSDDTTHPASGVPTRVEPDGANRVARIGWKHMWEEQSGRLTPAIHLQFRGKNNDILMKTVAEWMDVIFIGKSLSEILEEHMEKCAAILRDGQLIIPGGERLGHEIDNFQQVLERVRTKALELGNATNSETATDD